MKSAGLLISETDGKATLSSARFPAMLPALKTLAARCAQNPDPKLGKFNFARCDFKALAADYSPQVMDLYRVFSASDYAILSRLHAFFTEMGYQPLVRIYGIFSWEVKYQGKRQIKATPLFQVEYSERYKNPFRLHVKCASTNRIAALIPRQPRSLQEDFFKRANRCNGDKCGWCKNRPNLGPTVLEHDGSPVTLCWYTNPDVRVIDEDTVDLMKQYAWMHEELV